jgi:hypothetical protein
MSVVGSTSYSLVTTVEVEDGTGVRVIAGDCTTGNVVNGGGVVTVIIGVGVTVVVIATGIPVEGMEVTSGKEAPAADDCCEDGLSIPLVVPADE